jgi:hypothetical protein
MWQALHTLEKQTRNAVFARLDVDIDRLARAVQGARVTGTASGASLWVMPRRLQMRSLVLGTKPFIPHFRRLNEHFADSAQAPYFNYVLAHEYAIAELGRRALADDDDAVAPVKKLLGKVPS